MIEAQAGVLLSRDAFLTEQLGRDARTLDVHALVLGGDAGVASLKRELGQLSHPGFVTAKAQAGAGPGVVSTLRGCGFDVIDTAVTLERSRLEEVPPSPGYRVRRAEAGDEEAVVRVAVETLTTSRFSRDRQLTPLCAAHVKEAWVRNYFRGLRGEAMVIVSGTGTQAVDGFLLALSGSDGAMVIDLVAVAAHARRRGLCRLMCAAVQLSFPSAPSLRVCTQGSNVDSLSAYRRFGFGITRIDTVLHYHTRDDVKAGLKPV